MRVVIAGGHGKIALRLARLLADGGNQSVGLIRNPEHTSEVRAAGAEPVVCDLESAAPDDVVAAVEGADAVVFAAGAGPGSGVARKDTMDRAGAALLADAAERARVRRYLLISSMGLDRPSRLAPDDVFGAYLRAKAASEDDLRARDLDWTILRPGRLNDDPGTGQVRLAESVPRGAVSRQDVAAVVAGLLDVPASAGLTLELVGGDTPISDAVAAVTRG
ncbi:MAG: SDR family oxidoreductase [Micromonosporaceae bacterium]